MFQEYLWEVFLGYLLGNFSARDITRIKVAFHSAKRAHHGKLRKDGTPYFNHVVEAALLPFRFGVYNVELTITILLHDTIEENVLVTYDDIVKKFGMLQANRVGMLTKKKLSPKIKIGRMQAEQIISAYYFIALLRCDDWVVLLAKICDRLHNQLTLNTGTAAWRKKKNIETVKYFPRMLVRCHAQIRLAIDKGEIPEKGYITLIENLRAEYRAAMSHQYKKYFA